MTNFWEENKDLIKNVIIVVSVPVAITALCGISRLNKIIDANGLTELFYGLGEA